MKTKSTLFIKLLLIFMWAFVQQKVFAERGQIEQTEPFYTPSEGFPGYFDTNVTPKHSVALTLPLGNFNIGVTENFTLSVNAPLIFYMVDTWRPAFLFNARYRFFSNKRLSSTLTGYAGYFAYDNSEKEINLYFINGTYNNAITLSKKQMLATQVNAFAVRYKDESLNSSKYNKKYVNVIALSLGHTYVFTPKWSMQNIAAIPVLINFHEESENSNGVLALKHFKNYPFFYRLLFNWKVSNDSLLTFGGFLLTQTNTHLIVLPWLDWSIIF